MTNIYKQDLNRLYKPLSVPQQLVMHGKMRDGDTQAREDIINSCLPLVIDVAKKFRYNNKHIDLDDMIQEGNIALMKAVDSWDIKKGNLTTVVTWCVRRALIDLITDAKYSLKYAYSLSRRAALELRKIKRMESSSLQEISEETGLNIKRIKKLLSISPKGSRRVSYNKNYKDQQLVVEEEEDTSRVCMGDLIDLINKNLEGDQKTIFCLWAGVESKKVGPKEIARCLDKTEKYVYDTIYGAKRILSRAAKG
tara:strand:+ start:53 stop:808 length:756 start_codon:yes stop_codon:yes gene_type:complete